MNDDDRFTDTEAELREGLRRVFGPFEQFHDRITRMKHGVARTSLMQGRASPSVAVNFSPSHVPVHLALQSMKNLVEEPLTALPTVLPAIANAKRDYHQTGPSTSRSAENSSMMEDFAERRHKRRNDGFDSDYERAKMNRCDVVGRIEEDNERTPDSDRSQPLKDSLNRRGHPNDANKARATPTGAPSTSNPDAFHLSVDAKLQADRNRLGGNASQPAISPDSGVHSTENDPGDENQSIEEMLNIMTFDPAPQLSPISSKRPQEKVSEWQKARAEAIEKEKERKAAQEREKEEREKKKAAAEREKAEQEKREKELREEKERQALAEKEREKEREREAAERAASRTPRERKLSGGSLTSVSSRASSSALEKEKERKKEKEEKKRKEAQKTQEKEKEDRKKKEKLKNEKEEKSKKVVKEEPERTKKPTKRPRDWSSSSSSSSSSSDSSMSSASTSKAPSTRPSSSPSLRNKKESTSADRKSLRGEISLKVLAPEKLQRLIEMARKNGRLAEEENKAKRPKHAEVEEQTKPRKHNDVKVAPKKKMKGEEDEDKKEKASEKSDEEREQEKKKEKRDKEREREKKKRREEREKAEKELKTAENSTPKQKEREREKEKDKDKERKDKPEKVERNEKSEKRDVEKKEKVEKVEKRDVERKEKKEERREKQSNYLSNLPSSSSTSQPQQRSASSMSAPEQTIREKPAPPQPHRENKQANALFAAALSNVSASASTISANVLTSANQTASSQPLARVNTPVISTPSPRPNSVASTSNAGSSSKTATPPNASGSATSPAAWSCAHKSVRPDKPTRMRVPEPGASKSEFYQARAKECKHRADRESDRLLRVLEYMTSSMYFAASARHTQANSRQQGIAIFKDTSELLKMVVFQFIKPTDKALWMHFMPRVKILGQMMLAVMLHQQFMYKIDQAMKTQKVLDRPENKAKLDKKEGGQTPRVNGQAEKTEKNRLLAVAGQSSSMPRSPSSASLSSGAAATPNGAVVSSPAPLIPDPNQTVTMSATAYEMQKQHIRSMNLLLVATKYWHDAKQLSAAVDPEFVKGLENLCGFTLSVDSSIDMLGTIVFTGVAWLRAEYEAEKKMPVPPQRKFKGIVDITFKTGQFYSVNAMSHPLIPVGASGSGTPQQKIELQSDKSAEKEH